ncbi:MAG: Omp28-related outer membrane protein [Bacteroidales bacterium]|nr:Omp28-related outer membrane protein [Bacteroidales bacterium]
MKLMTFFSGLTLLICLTLQIKAQNYVSTDTTNKNAILEEYTGRQCVNCPKGHLTANNIAIANPDRFWAINIHAGYYAQTSYPNFNCDAGKAIHDGHLAAQSGYPCGAVNRSHGSGNGVTHANGWESAVNTQLTQVSPVNIGGVCSINPITRLATIQIELYYTSDGPGTSNKLSIAMLQNNILGSQSGMEYNPLQIVGDEYNHMHTLRDIITSVWGDEITTTSQGSLIEKKYEYLIPEIIGDPNGVEVILADLEFLAFIAEGDYFIITANKLPVTFEDKKPVNPVIASVKQKDKIACNGIKAIETVIFNGGSDEVTSILFELDINGTKTTQTWEGSILSEEQASIEFDIMAPGIESVVLLTILEINNTAVEQNILTTKEVLLSGDETISMEAPTNTITLRLWQDKYGSEISWTAYSSDMTILAEGGPYEDMPSAGVKLHEHEIIVKNDDCIRFVMQDSGGNGFNNTQGRGKYELEDDSGNIFFESDAKFEYEEVVSFFVIKPTGIEENDMDKIKVFPVPANSLLHVKLVDGIRHMRMINMMGQIVSETGLDGELKLTIDLTGFHKGAYSMQFINEQGEQVVKNIIISE